MPMRLSRNSQGRTEIKVHSIGMPCGCSYFSPCEVFASEICADLCNLCTKSPLRRSPFKSEFVHRLHRLAQHGVAATKRGSCQHSPIPKGYQPLAGGKRSATPGMDAPQTYAPQRGASMSRCCDPFGMETACSFISLQLPFVLARPFVGSHSKHPNQGTAAVSLSRPSHLRKADLRLLDQPRYRLVQVAFGRG